MQSMATAYGKDDRIRKVRFPFEEDRLVRSFPGHLLLATPHELCL